MVGMENEAIKAKKKGGVLNFNSSCFLTETAWKEFE